MDNCLRIVELGYTGVGKTTFMVAMYDSFQKKRWFRFHKGIRGFSLQSSEAEEHERLQFLAAQLKMGIYPAPTDARTEYRILLQHKQRNVIPFIWIDNRGGLMRERAAGNAAVSALLNDLRNADAIVAFYDCTKLESRDLMANQVGRLNHLLTEAIKGQDRIIPIALVLTKWDLVAGSGRNVTGPLESLIDALKQNQKIAFAVIQTACGAKRFQVELPLFFLLTVAAEQRLFQLRAEMQEAGNQARHYKAKADSFTGTFSDSWRGFKGETTYKQMSQVSVQQSQEAYRQMLWIEKPVRALKRCLRKKYGMAWA